MPVDLLRVPGQSRAADHLLLEEDAPDRGSHVADAVFRSLLPGRLARPVKGTGRCRDGPPLLVGRYAQSLRNKILATSVAHSCEGHSFWEGVQPSDLDGFRETAKEKLALSIARDKETLYAAQPTRESLKTHLQFSRARVAAVSATKIRDSAQRSAVSMPDAAFAALVNSPRGVTRGKSKAFLWCGRRTLSVIGCWMSPMTSPIRFDSNRCTISWQMWTSSVRPSIVPRKFGHVKFPGLFHYGRNNSLMAYLHFKGGISNASPLTTRHVNSSWRRSGCCTIGAEGPSGRTHGAAFIGGPPRHL